MVVVFRFFQRSAVVALLAVMLSFAVVVSQPDNAKALTVPPPIPPVIAGGAAAARVAGAGAVVCAASVVCLGVTGVAAVGVGLYATRDTWVPALKRWFGDGQPQFDGGMNPGRLYQSFGNVVFDSEEQKLYYRIYDTRTSGYPATARWIVHYSCQVPGGAFTWNTFTGVASIPAGGTYGTTSGGVVVCSSGTKMQAAFTSPDPAYPSEYPSNGFTWAGDGAAVEAGSVFRSTARCVKPDGSTQEVTVEYAGQPDGAPGFVVPSCSAAGVGSHASQVTVTQRLPGRTDFREIWKVTPDAPSQYPDCDPALPSSANCVLRVWVDGQVCSVGDARCLEWQSHDAVRVQCKWGNYVVALSYCDMLENAYRPGGASLGDPDNLDGNPATQPGTTPGTGTGTSPGTGTVTVTPPVNEGEGATSAESVTSCAPSGWQWLNPAAYVKATGCLFEWAFVPPESPIPQWTQTLQASLPALPSFSISEQGGCGIPITLPAVLGGISFNVVPVCPGEPAHAAAGIVKVVMTGAVTVAFAVVTVGLVTWGMGWSNPLSRGRDEARA